MRWQGLGFVALGLGVVWPTRAGAQTAPSTADAPAPAADTAPGQPAAPPAAPGQPSPYPYAYGYPPPSYPPPSYPPPGYAPYGYPPGYSPYYPYAQPPRPPATRPYVAGQKVPAGYHLEEHNKRGLVVAGTIVFAIPYTIGVSIVGGEGFPNSTGFLVLPAVGPWITLAARHSTCPAKNPNDLYNDYSCTDDDFARSMLIFDGITQTTGAVLLIAGVSWTTKLLVRDDALVVAPTRIGSGYGLGAAGRF